MSPEHVRCDTDTVDTCDEDNIRPGIPGVIHGVPGVPGTPLSHLSLMITCHQATTANLHF